MTHNQGVPGSSPGGTTTKNLKQVVLGFFYNLLLCFLLKFGFVFATYKQLLSPSFVKKEMKYFFYLYLFFFSISVNASHIIGGEIYYDYLGNNQYRFYISVYRDCNSTGAEFDDPMSLGVFSNSNGNLIQEVLISFPGKTPVPVTFNNPCVVPPSNICTEHALYQAVISLPPSTLGYTISYQRCCRGPNINNINQPGDTGFTLTCVVPGAANNFNINSSPRFNDYPPQLLCNNDDLIFDHSATDPDGDQLVYSLVQPHSGASSFQPMPMPPPSPPYGNVVWSNGYSTNNPLGPGASINIDPNTGLLTASPNLTGRFVVGVQVEEIRNGVVINRTIRDFIFNVFNCQIQLEAILPTQEQLPGFTSYCQGLTVNFVNNSYGGTNYYWDFGVPGTNTDISTSFSPSFTYPQSGHYTVTLIVNPGWPCTDTAYMDVYVNDPFVVSFTSDDSLCFGQPFNFSGTTNAPSGSTFEWNFSPSGTPSSVTGILNVNNVVFSSSGFIPITLTVNYDTLCSSSYTDSVFIFPEPLASFEVPQDIACIGLTVPFNNTSSNNAFNLWDFGDGNSSSDIFPIHTFTNPGTYTTTLIVGNSPLCRDTTTHTFTVYEPLNVDFTVSDDSLCIVGNSFDFTANVSGPSGATYSWDFGPNASISSSNNLIENNVSFSTPGVHYITLTGTFLNCSETATHTVYLFQEPTIDFSLEAGLQCAPFNAQFIDLSFAESEILYQWDFGDGDFSSEQNPSHTYFSPGSYPVSLTIITTSGCIDTLTMTKPDLINIHPSPVADFSVSPEKTDICNSTIDFLDFSSLATSYFYFFDDDSLTYDTLANPIYTYLSAGTHYPTLVVTSDYGCKDTTRRKIIIEPFTIYAPNSFTPDGNQFNNIFLPVVYLPLESWSLKIFNRWGELVFESRDINIGWDGTTQTGFPAPDGIYIWKATYISCEPLSSEETITGHVSLIR